jgi:hypothetical protein
MYLFGSLVYVIGTELVSLGHPAQGAATHTQQYGGLPPVALASGALLQGCARRDAGPTRGVSIVSEPCRISRDGRFSSEGGTAVREIYTDGRGPAIPAQV